MGYPESVGAAQVAEQSYRGTALAPGANTLKQSRMGQLTQTIDRMNKKAAVTYENLAAEIDRIAGPDPKVGNDCRPPSPEPNSALDRIADVLINLEERLDKIYQQSLRLSGL